MVNMVLIFHKSWNLLSRLIILNVYYGGIFLFSDCQDSDLTQFCKTGVELDCNVFFLLLRLFQNTAKAKVKSWDVDAPGGWRSADLLSTSD